MVHHGGQCGYCTPGIVCSLGHLAETSQRQGKKIDRRRAQNYLTGNLCRCTGYEPILKAAEAIDLTQWVPLSLRYQGDEMIERFRYLDRQSVEIDLADKKLWIPTTIEGVIDIKQDRPHVRLVSGATDLGVIHNKGRQYLDEAIVLNRIPELTDFQVRDDGVWIGSMVDLSTTERELEAVIPEMSRLLRIFASPQIKNQGTLVGNVLNGSPIGDSIPGLMVLEARLCLISAEGERWVSLGDFYKGYKKMDIRPEEICTGIMIPKPGKEWKAKFFKVSLRKDLDISSVTFAGLFKINDSRILEARIALGGVGPMVVRLSQLENELAGESFSLSSFEQVGKQASLKIKPISDLRASESYRRRVTENLFVKCFTELKQEVME